MFVAKAWLGGGGVTVALAGMATQRRWLVWTALALLSIAFLLRFVERKSPESR
jgi:membrane protein implicated in regulation of membrane protease activity